MKKCRITVMKRAVHDDLMELYELPLENACDMKIGDVFIANGWKKPDGFCNSTWDSVSPFVLALSSGSENIFDEWMKNKKSAMVSCNDGFRPVSFYVEALDEDVE